MASKPTVLKWGLKTRFKKGHKVPEEWKKTIGGATRFKEGQPSWNAGTREWCYCIDCNKKLTGHNIKRCDKCFHKFNKGENHASYGKKHTKETLEKNRIATTKRWQNPEWRAKVLKARIGKQKGENGSNWKGGITPLTSRIKSLDKYSEWREKVFERDNYTCQKCKIRSGGLAPHHKKPFSILFKEFLQEYNQFSPIEDKETLVRLASEYAPFWALSNGQTLCNDCHKLTDTYGRKAEKWALSQLY